ncbi:MAG: hypothetical protein KAV82_13825 [Phycisphaerae bacterium]|nr:hypothetical protein [Phycisphaerae bacterium]
MRFFLIIGMGLSVIGCGPLTAPMVVRLNDEYQQKVDEAWVNMFSPPGRLDRALLLDVLLCNQFHQLGVDRLRLVSEKRVGEGLAVMEVRFDRNDPTFDDFTIAYLDGEGYEVRRERYPRGEIEERIKFLLGPIAFPPNTSATSAEVCEEWESHAAEREVRMEEIKAAITPLESESIPGD